MDIDRLLDQRKIKSSMLIPKLPAEGNEDRILIGIDPNDPAPFPPYLPLELFDNTEYDCRNPEEWLALGMENGVRKPIPGKAYLPTWDDHKHCELKLGVNLYLS